MFLDDLLIGPLVFIAVWSLALVSRGYFTDSLTRKYFLPALFLKILGAIALGLVYKFYYSGGDTYAFHEYGSKIIWQAFVDNPIKGIKLWLSQGIHSGDIYNYSSRIWFWRGSDFSKSFNG